MNIFTTDHPMMSEPSCGMKTSTMVFTVMALLSLVAAGLIWLLALRNKQMATPVVEMPINFEEGFSFTNSFTVNFEGYYLVQVVCPRTTPVRFHGEDVFSALKNQLPVHVTIICGGKVVAEGDSPIRDGSFSNKEDTRRLAMFEGEPSKNYELSFRTEGAVPALDATKPTLRIRLTQRVTIGNILLHLCTPSLASGIGVLGLLFALSPCSFWAQKLFTKNSKSSNTKSEFKA